MIQPGTVRNVRDWRGGIVTTLELQVLSQARLRALVLLSDASAHPVEIASVAGSDPALTALMLQAANSAFSAPRDRVNSVHDAIVRIGTRDARRILGTAVLTRSFRSLLRAGLDERSVWRHAILCALLAEGLTNLEPHTPPVRPRGGVHRRARARHRAAAHGLERAEPLPASGGADARRRRSAVGGARGVRRRSPGLG